MLPELNPGTSINSRYQIQRLLGQGGFGRTYLAVDTQRFGDYCVLKEFVPANTAEPVLLKSRELFEREAKILYQLNHPQIPKFLAWLTEKQRIFIVQEYIEGDSYSRLLGDRLSIQKKPFSEAEVIQWLLDLLPVLEYIHQRNIIHRDISPDNVMLSRKLSKPVLIDFGVVKQKFTQILAGDSSNPSHSVAGSVVGKVGYSPPEQIRMGRSYPCSDLYALGVSALVLLTGKMPRLLLDQSFQWQWKSYVKVSDFLTQILEKMLAERPAYRYQSAREVLNLLQSQSSSGGINVTPSHQNVRIHGDPVNKVGLPETKLPKETKESSRKSQKPIQNTEKANELPAENTTSIKPEFVEYCRRELTSFVGPFASFVLEDTLDKNPQITPEQLVEVLVEKIPDQRRGQEFKKRLNLPRH
ncbi:serine/threonine-protein kinase [Brasilonema bromeliae]|uniref:non-specific serine/threonine protein kinase n=1 Tax=Brasilonema bromeliae SPC951 TaxID=385972 RepID=A0ABX1P2Y1_9CYAN|nr:serine/threonine-protein kinase [Brasilonema bromeliae]NMG18020.1 serine/threonine protein kinase [Brasilonema bromeliae SPC951]